VKHNSTNKHEGTYRYRRPHEGFFAPSQEEREQEKQERYEEAVIKRILKHIGKWDLRYKLWYKQKDQSDFGRLAFYDFQEATDFPMWLETRRMDMAKHLSLVNLLRDINQAPFLAAFREVFRVVPNRMAGCPVGLVFPVPGIKYMVLHNWPSGPAEHGDTRIAIPLDGSVLTLEKLDDLLKAVGTQDT
jgi:hypothetical protein